MAERECTCGLPHDRESRLRILRRMLPRSVQEIGELYPCLWPLRQDSNRASRTLFKDLGELGAVCFQGEWYEAKALEKGERQPEARRARAVSPRAVPPPPAAAQWPAVEAALDVAAAESGDGFGGLMVVERELRALGRARQRGKPDDPRQLLLWPEVRFERRRSA